MPPSDQNRDQADSRSRRNEVRSLLKDLDAQVGKPGDTGPEKPRGKPRGILYVVLAILVLANVWIWVAQPTWIFGDRDGISSVEEAEGLLRFRMYVQAQRIGAFERQHDRLPENLAETGEPFEGIRYVRTGDGGWELIGEFREARLTLPSSMPIAEFLQEAEP
jgi:hypothetical protein